MLICVSDVLGQQYQRYKQLNDNWYYFNENQRHQSYRPTVNEQKIFLTLDRSLPDSSVLQMTVGANTSIFIDEQIVDFSKHNSIISYSIDSLFLAQSIDVDQLTIMLCHPDGVVVTNSEILKPVFLSKTTIPAPTKRMNSNYENVLLLLILVILITFTYIKVNHEDIWKGYMKWSKLVLLKDQGDAIYKLRPFEKRTLIIVFAYTILGATAILGLLYLSGFLLPEAEYFQSEYVSLVILKWFVLVLLLFVIAFSKYFLVQSFTRLFNFKKALRIHFYNHIRISMVILIVLLIIEVILIFVLHEVTLFNWLTNLMIILLLIKSLLISLKLINISSYRMFHLFSYLCTTELIPTIILVKITFLI